MSIRVHLYSGLQSYTENRNLMEVNGTTVGECLADLVRQYPELKNILFNKTGTLSENIFISVNLESPQTEQQHTPVKEGDQIYLILIVSGG